MAKPSSAKRVSALFTQAALIAFSGAGVAACGGLPFYVYFNPENFGPPTMHFTGVEEMATQAAQVSAQRQRQISTLVKPKLQLDQIVTGSIARDRSPAQAKSSRRPDRQAFPLHPQSAAAVDVLYATKNRALIVDSGKLATVSPGAILSDGSTVESVRSEAGHWVVVTSTGAKHYWQHAN